MHDLLTAMKPVAVYYKILKYQEENLALLHRYFDVLEIEHPGVDHDAALKRAEMLFAPLGFDVDSERLDKCPNLKVIVSNTTGIPHLDLKAAKSRGVSICALHDQQAFLDTISATAEHTIGLMMAASRRIPAAHQAAASGSWDRRPWGAPRMMSRMRIGIVGYGRLGRKVARAAFALGMKVAWYDPYVSGVPGRVTDLLELARQSDVLSLHAVANEETRGLVGRRVLEALPKRAIVINTARGELLDTDALLDLLESGHLWAAALDTLDGEYRLDFPNHFADTRIARYAREHPNLILTPHIGGSTVDAWAETELRVIQAACRVFGLEIEATK